MKTNKTYGWYFALGAVLLYTVLFVIPSIMSIYLSLTNWNVSSTEIKFIGIENYIKIFTQGNYPKYVGRTIEFAVVTSILKALIGLGLALLLNKGLKTRNVLRALYFLPVIVSPLIIGIIFNSICHPNGIINSFLGMIGLDSWENHWLTDKALAFPTVMVVEVWRYSGFNMAIFLAGLQMIDQSYYEAAAIDGAGPFKKFTRITIPYLMPSITINLVLNIMTGLKVFDVVFTLTKGGPGDITDVLNTVIFREYSSGRYGFATALGVVLFVLTAIFSLLVYRSLSKREVEL